MPLVTKQHTPHSPIDQVQRESSQLPLWVNQRPAKGELTGWWCRVAQSGTEDGTEGGTEGGTEDGTEGGIEGGTEGGTEGGRHRLVVRRRSESARVDQDAPPAAGVGCSIRACADAPPAAGVGCAIRACADAPLHREWDVQSVRAQQRDAERDARGRVTCDQLLYDIHQTDPRGVPI
jgi:hypothetical protein